MDVSVFNFIVWNITLSKFLYQVFVENVNSLGRATHEYIENWAIMSSNDSTVIDYFSDVFRLKKEYGVG